MLEDGRTAVEDIVLDDDDEGTWAGDSFWRLSDFSLIGDTLTGSTLLGRIDSGVAASLNIDVGPRTAHVLTTGLFLSLC